MLLFGVLSFEKEGRCWCLPKHIDPVDCSGLLPKAYSHAEFYILIRKSVLCILVDI